MKSKVMLLIHANEYPSRAIETPELDKWLRSTGWKSFSGMVWQRSCPPYEVLDLAKSIGPHIPKDVFALLWYVTRGPTINVRLRHGEPLQVMFY
jgi:hypothetical protein